MSYGCFAPPDTKTFNVSICVPDDATEGVHIFTVNAFDEADVGYGEQIVSIEVIVKIPVDIDIKPGSCPNPFNGKSQGSVPVAILGAAGFDVTTIDPASITLAGVPIMLKHVSYADVSAPIGDPAECYDCFDEDTDLVDGYLDLVLKFDTQLLKDAIDGAFLPEDRERDDCVELELVGLTLDGVPIEGSDSMVIRTK